MRNPILARNEDHRRGADLARRTSIVSRAAVDVDSLLGAVVGLHCFADAVDAVGVESDGGALKGFDPVEVAAALAFGRGDARGGRVDLLTQRGEGVSGGMAHVESEEYVAGAGIHATRGEAQDTLPHHDPNEMTCQRGKIALEMGL